MTIKLTTLASLTVLCLTMTSAFAASPSSDLKVKGQLVVPVCTVASADNGVYNLGKQPATLIKPGSDTPLPTQTKIWTITCDAETYLNFSHTDNRQDSVSSVNHTGGTNFGLGHVNGTGKIGFYKVLFENGTVDGDKAAFFITQNGSIAANNYKTALNLYNDWRFGWAETTIRLPKSGKTFAADVSILPTLTSSQNMNGPIVDDTNIDGSLTFIFAFGL